MSKKDVFHLILMLFILVGGMLAGYLHGYNSAVDDCVIILNDTCNDDRSACRLFEPEVNTWDRPTFVYQNWTMTGS